MKTLKFIPLCFIVFILTAFIFKTETVYSQPCKMVFCNCCDKKQSYIVLDSAGTVVGSFDLGPYECSVPLGGWGWPAGSTYHIRNVSLCDSRVIDVYVTICPCGIEALVDTIYLPCCPSSVDKSGRNLNDIKDFKLNQNFPNPFNPSTKISFELPKTANVTLTIYDAAGKVVSELISGNSMEAGYYEYDWNTSGKDLASGVYFYKLQAGSYTDEKKMVLIK